MYTERDLLVVHVINTSLPSLLSDIIGEDRLSTNNLRFNFMKKSKNKDFTNIVF